MKTFSVTYEYDAFGVFHTSLPLKYWNFPVKLPKPGSDISSGHGPR
jgi:hypothetical protein